MTPSNLLDAVNEAKRFIKKAEFLIAVSDCRHPNYGRMDVEAKISDRANGIHVHQSSFGIVFTREATANEWVFFNTSEYELITEEEPAQQQQTIEQLLKELAQVNEHGLALANRKNELLAILNPRLNPLGFTYALINDKKKPHNGAFFTSLVYLLLAYP
jgi:hypothetical protein